MDWEKLGDLLNKMGGASEFFSAYRDCDPIKLEVKAADDGDGFEAVATTDALDRDQEVVLPLGCMYDNFMKNPVMLNIHDYRREAIGRVNSIEADKKQLRIKFEFADTEEGRKLNYLYKAGFQKAFSIGFYPRKWTDIDTENPPKSVEVELPDGKKQRVDLSKYSHTPRRVFNQWELLEVSPVPVPSNPEALLRHQVDLVRRKAHNPTVGEIAAVELSERAEEVLTVYKSFVADLDEYDFKKRAVAPHSTPVEIATWDGAAAAASLARWASSDGSGDKDKISWAKFARGFTWYDQTKPENITSYKLPHHTIREGNLIAIWRGVTAAMGALLGARGGVDLPEGDRRAVYNHLARHYRDFEREPPEFREYDEAQLKNIEEGNEPDHVEPTTPEGTPPAGEGSEEGKTDNLDNLKRELFERLEEFEASVTVRVTILQEMFKDFVEVLNKRFGDEPRTEDEDVTSTTPVIDSELKAMLDTMETGPTPEGGGE
jgi:phage head maturation protease